jgi:hypothetical protein
LKRAINISLIGIYLLAFTECHQLLRIPFMVQHFQKHKLADQTMTFRKFIAMHYFNAVAVTDDFQQDQQLPFRSVDCHMMGIAVYVHEPLVITLDPIIEPSRIYRDKDEINKPQFSSFDIFQPPRLA